MFFYPIHTRFYPAGFYGLMILVPILSNLILALFLVVDVANSLLLSVYIELVTFYKAPFAHTPQPKKRKEKTSQTKSIIESEVSCGTNWLVFVICIDFFFFEK